ncbi:hypothetical protein K523DRAFT_422248 [Schizophyllum commune Tattone D]|nr:hypothetical protein K523DRAFT_422248 [Schizophyllum commune Tattone D]
MPGRRLRSVNLEPKAAESSFYAIFAMFAASSNRKLSVASWSGATPSFAFIYNAR